MSNLFFVDHRKELLEDVNTAIDDFDHKFLKVYHACWGLEKDTLHPQIVEKWRSAVEVSNRCVT